MNIIVCMKIVPSQDEMNFDPKSKTVNRNICKSIINPYDRYALEQAVQLKRKLGGKITVLSMGKQSYQSVLKETVAYGADEIIYASDFAFGGADTLATSYVLAKSIEKIGKYDVVLCGKQSQDSETAQIGPQLSERLGIPNCYNVKNIEADHDKLLCECLTEKGNIILEVEVPCLLTVSIYKKNITTPTLKAIMKAQKIEPITWNAEDIGVNKSLCGTKGSATKVVYAYQPHFLSSCEKIEGNPEEQSYELASRIMEIVHNGFKYENKVSVALSETKYQCKVQNNGAKENHGVWVYCELVDGCICKVSLELLCKGRKLADDLNQKLIAIIIGDSVHVQKAVHDLSHYSIDDIYTFELEVLRDFDENLYTDVMENIIRKEKASILLVGATFYGKNLAARLAVRLETGLTADCIELEISKENGLLLQTRTTFGGNLYAVIVCPKARPQIVTVKENVFSVEYNNMYKRHPREKKIHIKLSSKRNSVKVKQINNQVLNRSTKDIIISYGRGICSKENIEMVRQLAELLGAELGASRAAVDLGYAYPQMQIGQSGRTVMPNLYIAIGISGALQHLEGMRNSHNIIAINVDERAPIFKIADIGVIADAKLVLPKLIEHIKMHTKRETP